MVIDKLPEITARLAAAPLHPTTRIGLLVCIAHAGLHSIIKCLLEVSKPTFGYSKMMRAGYAFSHAKGDSGLLGRLGSTSIPRLAPPRPATPQANFTGPLSKMGKVTMISSDGELGADKITDEVATVMAQIPAVVGSLTGIDMATCILGSDTRTGGGEDGFPIPHTLLPVPPFGVHSFGGGPQHCGPPPPPPTRL